jgi:arylsulfatase A-like enzyme
MRTLFSHCATVVAEAIFLELKQAGYTTGIPGKWGLGDGDSATGYSTSGYPLARGFDFFVGQSSQVGCHDWYPSVVQNQSDIASTVVANQYIDTKNCLHSATPACYWANDMAAREGVGFIRAHAHDAAPFFLYLATTTPHVGSLAGVVNAWPTPLAYMSRFGDGSGPYADWPLQQRQFASAVWAQDEIVGAVLRELKAQRIVQDTLVMFSGDNGPDSHALAFFDDPGPFRGKKRSLHEGGVRQTIVALWPGTIPPNSTSRHVFAFWDLLPTAADLAGLDRALWPATDGVSVAPLLTHGAAAQAETHEYLYWEFCDHSKVDGLLPQAYAPGWNQAVRFDQGAREWKAIRSNSDNRSVLLYDLATDVSESISVASNPAHAAVVAAALGFMREAHIEDRFWKSSQNASDECCASCFKHTGCPYPCVGVPAPTPPPSPPIPLTDLSGPWSSTCSEGPCRFSLEVGADRTITIHNDNSTSSCWDSGDGIISVDGRTISNVACTAAPSCIRHASAVVRADQLTQTVNNYYPFGTGIEYTIVWNVDDTGGMEGPVDGRAHRWPDWKRTVMFDALVPPSLLDDRLKSSDQVQARANARPANAVRH